MTHIPLFKVFMPPEVMTPLKATLQSGFLTQGPQVKEFEKQLRRFLSADSLVTVNSATSALHLALRLIGIGPGDEVLTTALTCTATNWPILLSGADLKWCDVDLDSCNISPQSIKENITDKTKAIMVVHWGGYPCDLDEIRAVAGDIPIIEDCAHAFGAMYKKKMIGTHGNYAAFSFQAIKHLTTGDGGCLTMPSEELERAKLLRWYGIDREARSAFRCEGDITEVGDKLHMNDLNATIGIEQMKHIDSLLDKHQFNALFYNKRLASLDGVTLLQQKTDRESASWLYTMRVSSRDEFMKKMEELGISTSRVHERNDKHSCVAQYKTELPNVDALTQDMVCIPVGWWVTKEEREYIVECIKNGW